MAGDELSFDIESPDLAGFFARAKSFDPKLATSVRRELRATGDSSIAAQRAILNGPKPGNVSVASREYRLIVPRNGRKPYFARRNVYAYGEAKSGGVGELRDEIAAGLRLRVVAGQTRQSIGIKTSGPRNAGYNMARVWQQAQFRHPVFGTPGAWTYQRGQDYFWGPLTPRLAQMQRKIQAIVEDALAILAQQ